MNEAYIHLITNHFPIIGLFVSLVFLLFAYFLKYSKDFMRVGLWMTFILAITTIPAYLSGEGAEEILEHMNSVDHSLIEIHEEKAKVAFILSQILALIAVSVLFFSRKKSLQFLKTGTLITILSLIFTLIFLAISANTGGKISHPELRNSFSAESKSLNINSHHDE